MNEIKPPLIVLNFKNYIQSVGDKGLKLAKIAEEVAKETNTTIILCPQTVDIRLIASEVDIPVFAQHVDPNEPGSHTGNNLIEAIKEAGAVGTLVNHSEHRLKLSDIERIIERTKKADMFTIVCANNIKTSRAAAAMEPKAVAMEPPELIGSGISVTTRPDLVKRTIAEILSVNPKVIPLVGAGVTSSSDVSEAIRLGSKGVLLASGFVKASDPRSVLLGMAEALSQ